jgi:hypothetical protein
MPRSSPGPATSSTSDLEVLGEDTFNWVCSGKAKWVGYGEWKQRLNRAVDIFGRGNVDMQGSLMDSEELVKSIKAFSSGMR